MSHPAQMNFVSRVKTAFPDAFNGKKVLEIGSLNINGSVRPLFVGCDYTGLDVAPGKDVDLVSTGHEYDGAENSLDVAISCECFEHNPQWIETFKNMIRMTKPGGLIIMTCAAPGRSEHGTSRTTPENSPLTVGLGWDYYKNLAVEDFDLAFNMQDFFANYEFITNVSEHDLYFWGIVKK